MNNAVFSPADILIPQVPDLEKWSVIACDQHTSEPEYWRRVDQKVGDAPSTLRLVLPEIYLEEPVEQVNQRIAAINAAMQSYLEQDVFRMLPESYIYVERTIAPGKIRHGLIGKIDLEAYEYGADSQSPVRPTEGTVQSRIPPRVRVRENAPLESPHIMLLIDDDRREVIKPLGLHTNSMELLYHFDLMESGGNIRGWLVDGENREHVNAAFCALSQRLTAYVNQYAPQKQPLLVAVGDGNHSLATAKANFEALKKTMPREQWQRHPARWALAELVNVHDESLEFQPIHRVLFGVDPQKVRQELYRMFDLSEHDGGGQSFEYVIGTRRMRVYADNPPSHLAAGSVQGFIDAYLKRYGGSVDYIHGADVAAHLCRQENTFGFLLPAMKKSQLFQTVLLDGALPRKTFSMGEAQEKRYYLECRKIR